MLSSALNFLTDKRRRFLRAETVPVFDPEHINFTVPSQVTNPEQPTDPSAKKDALGGDDERKIIEGVQSDRLTRSSSALAKSSQKQRREVYSRAKKLRGNSHTITGWVTKTNSGTNEPGPQETYNLQSLKIPSREDFINCSSGKSGDNFSPSDSSDSADRRNTTTPSPHDTICGLDNTYSPAFTKDLTPTDQLKAGTSREHFTSESIANGIERYRTANPKRNTATSQHGRMARMRAKAAVRAAGKARNLHRSQSSVQIRDGHDGDDDNRCTPVEANATAGGQVQGSSSSSQKEATEEKKVKGDGTTADNLTVPVGRKARCEKRSKPWVERTAPRSRSAASHIYDSQHSTSTDGSHVHLNHHDLLAKALLLGTSAMPLKIHTPECTRSQARHLASPWQPPSGETPELVSSADYARQTDQKLNLAPQCSTPLLAPPVESGHLKWSEKTSKRRLRRNNSSNYNDRGIFAGTHGNKSSINPTVFTAGDLMLPSNLLFMKQHQQKAQKSANDTVAGELIDMIERDSLIQLVDRIASCELDVHKLSVANGLSLLDCACLLSSPEVIAFFMSHNFEPGFWLKTAMDKGPIPSRLKDPIKFHLNRKIAEADDNLKLARAITQATVNHANELKMGVVKLKSTSEENDELNTALVEVERAEVNYAECILVKNRFLKFFAGLDRFPSISWPPFKVNIVVTGNNSIMVRVSQPRSGGFLKDQEISEFECSDLSSGEYSHCKPPCDGRQFAEKSNLQFSKLTLCYRIEWSTCKEFSEGSLQSCVVRPPLRQVHGQDRVDIGRLHRTGFYELCELSTNVNVYVRVFAFSIRGWSEPCSAQPVSLKPSAWFTYSRSEVDNDKQTNGEDLPDQRPPRRYIGSEMDTELTQAKLLLDRFLLNWHMKRTPESSNLNIDGGNDDGIIRKRSKSPILQRKRSFRFLFPNKTVKFVKQTKSGVYMAILCYAPTSVHEPKVGYSQSTPNPLTYWDIKEGFQLVTADDGSLPMLNVTREDVTAHGNFYMDINWMARLLSSSNNGTEMHLISEQLSQGPVPANLQFRVSLLTALQRLQSSLGSSEVGQFYPEVFKAKIVESVKKQSSFENHSNSETIGVDGLSNDDTPDNGLNVKNETPSEPAERPQNTSCVLLLIKQLPDIKAANLSSGLKWCTMQKFIRQQKITVESNTRQTNGQTTGTDTIRESVNGRSIDGSDQMILTPESHIVSRLENLLWYSERRDRRLQPGLYVAFIQMQASLEQQPTILGHTYQDVVNMLPVERVRHRSHVTYTEWALLHALSQPDRAQTPPPLLWPMGEDVRFIRKLNSACSRLSKRISVQSQDLFDLRLYLPELIQISSKHAFILMFPPAEQVCLAPLQKTPIPVNCYWQSMSHFERSLSIAYDPFYFCRISNLTAILEVLVPMSLFLQRQCFTDAEMTQSVQRTSSLQSLQRDLDTTYQNNRWLGTAISAARDRKRPSCWTLHCSALSTFIQELLAKESEPQEPTPQSPTAKDIPVEDMPCNTEFVEEPGMSILQVYASYSSGLPPGTSVRLLMGLSTTAGEVVALVVKRLSEVVVQQQQKQQEEECFSTRREIYCDTGGEKEEHCLTVSLDSGLKYFLPGHFRPLLLRQPWRTGRFAISAVDKGRIHKHDMPVLLRGEVVHPTEKVMYTEPIRFKSLHISTIANPFIRANVFYGPVFLYPSAEDKVS